MTLRYKCPKCKQEGGQEFWDAHACLVSVADPDVWYMLPEAAAKIVAGTFEFSDEAAGPESNGSVAVIPIHGPIAKKRNFWDISQEDIRDAIQAALDDPQVESIVLDIDSPGGAAAGLQDLTDWMLSVRGQKPILTVAEGTMASAALWIGAAADKVIASRDAGVGSIGSVIIHAERSKALEDFGIRVNIIRSGANKFEGSSFEPLSEAARKRFQARVDEAAAAFKDGLMKARGLDSTESFGSGEMFTAKDALGRGLIDEIGTLDSVVKELTAKSGFNQLSQHGDTTVTDEEKQELERLRAKQAEWAAIAERQRNTAFDEAKAEVMEPLRQRVQNGTLAPAVLEEISSALESQRKDWTESAALNIPARLLEKLAAHSLPGGTAATDERPPKRDKNMREDDAFTRAVQEHMAKTGKPYAQAWREVAQLEPELAQAYWQATAGPDFHNIAERRAS